jgi:hypothetical protein
VWHEAMISSNIDIFELSHEECVPYFNPLENLEKIRRTNGPGPATLPVNMKSFPLISSAGKSSNNLKVSCGVTIVTRTTTTWLISMQLPNSNSRKRLALNPKMEPERSLWFSFSEVKPVDYLESLLIAIFQIDWLINQIDHCVLC